MSSKILEFRLKQGELFTKLFSRCTYGTGIGPVIKNFSGTPLSFLEGLRPKMTLTNVGLGVIGQPNIVKIAPQEASTNNRTEITGIN